MTAACVCGHPLLAHQEEICPRGTVTGRCTSGGCTCSYYEPDTEGHNQ